MKKLLLILFLLPFFAPAQNNVYLFNALDGTPMKRYDTTINGWVARVLVKQNHDYSTDSTEGLIDVGGLGEVGTDTSKLGVNGYGYWISRARWDGSVVLPSGIHHPIIVVLQASASWPGESTAETRLNTILNRWRIKRRAVHVSGLSMGGWTWTTQVTSDAGSPYARAFRITSVVESGGANPNENVPYPNLFDQFADYGARGFGGNLLSFQQDLDGRDALARVNRMNTNHPGSYYIQTNFGSRGHTNFNDHYNPLTTNWTTSNAEVTTTTPAGGLNMSMAQWQLLQGDTTTTGSGGGGGGGGGTITANAGTDFSLLYDQNGAARTYTITGSQTGGTSPVYSWVSLFGNPSPSTITNPSSAATTVTGATVPGYYGYELTVSEGAVSDKDTVYVQIRDGMKRGFRPCRVGAPVIHTFGNVLIPGRVTTTEMYAQHITRDNLLPAVQGGDIIMIPENPNNDTGYWRAIHLGDISGSPGCPIRVVPDSVSGMTVVSGPQGTTRGIYIATADNPPGGTADSNTVAHLIIDGTYWHHKTGNWYGFRADNRAYPYDSSNTVTHSLNMGMALHLAHHVEVKGFAVWNAGYMFQVKIYSDSTQPFTIYNNFVQRGNWFHDNYAWKTNYEGQYLGHTDWDGSYQPLNDGPTLMQDSLISERNVFIMPGQDGIQISNHKYGAIVRNNLVVQSGYRNVSSHRWGIFSGGNANTDIYGNTVINARGPIGAFNSYGPIHIYNNIVDSVDDGANVENGYYAQNNARWAQVPDTMRVFFENNLLARIAQTGNYSHGRVVNDSGRVGKGAIRNNIFQHLTKTLISQLVTSAANDTISGNTIVSSVDISASALAEQDSYKMYELFLTVPNGTPISFYDLVGTPPADPPKEYHGIKVKLIGIKFKFRYK